MIMDQQLNFGEKTDPLTTEWSNKNLSKFLNNENHNELTKLVTLDNFISL